MLVQEKISEKGKESRRILTILGIFQSLSITVFNFVVLASLPL
jgi:hypothetical protein